MNESDQQIIAGGGLPKPSDPVSLPGTRKKVRLSAALSWSLLGSAIVILAVTSMFRQTWILVAGECVSVPLLLVGMVGLAMSGDLNGSDPRKLYGRQGRSKREASNQE